MYLLYNKTKTKTNTEPYTPCVKLSVPLLIRLLEYAHEDAASDEDLHWIAERITQHSDKVLTMEHYTQIVPEGRLVTVEVKPGQKIEVENINE